MENISTELDTSPSNHTAAKIALIAVGSVVAVGLARRVVVKIRSRRNPE